MPIKSRNFPDPKYKAKASIMPIPAANSKAVDTEDNCFLSAGLPLVLSSREPPHVQQSDQISNESENTEPVIYSQSYHQTRIKYNQQKHSRHQPLILLHLKQSL